MFFGEFMCVFLQICVDLDICGNTNEKKVIKKFKINLYFFFNFACVEICKDVFNKGIVVIIPYKQIKHCKQIYSNNV